MTTEEAIKACWWTTNIAETIAIGTTSNQEAGLHFNGDEFQYEQWSNPTRLGWTITVPRWVRHRDLDTNEMTQVENLAYSMIVAEIERRERTEGS